MSDSNVVAPSLSALRRRHSSKWRRFTADVLPMHVAEMDFQIADSIRNVIVEMAQSSDLGYLGPVPEVAEAFAGFAKRRWNWSVDTAQVKMATDVGVAAVEIFRTLGAPGDKVVVNPPVYGSFYHWIEEAKLEQVDVPLARTDRTWQLDLNALEVAFADGAKFYLLCHPHNPVGKIYSLEELQAIAVLAEKYGVIVISDEIHAPLTYAGETFVPYLNAGEAAAKTGIIITSSSKAWNTAGLKAAIIVSHDDAMAARLSKLQPDVHWRTSILGAFAMAEAYTNGVTWIDSAIQTIESNYAFMSAQVAEKLPSVVVAQPQNSYLSWWDVTALNLGENPAATILAKAKVAVVPGTDLGAGYGQFIRFNFGTSQANIEAAIDAIAVIR